MVVQTPRISMRRSRGLDHNDANDNRSVYEKAAMRGFAGHTYCLRFAVDSEVEGGKEKA